MGGSNQASTFPPLPVYVEEPPPGTAFQLDRFMTAATSAAQLAALVQDPRGTRCVQLLSQTYDVSDLLPAFSQLRVGLLCVGPTPARIVNRGAAKTWTTYASMSHVAFEGVNLDFDLGTSRLERVSCDALCTATGGALDLTLKDCALAAPADLGVADLTALDCEFDALTIRPVRAASLKTCTHTGPLTVRPPTTPNARVFVHGSLFRPPAALSSLAPMLDLEIGDGGRMHLSNIVVDLESAAPGATIGNLLRVSTDAAQRVFLCGLTVAGPASMVPTYIGFSTGVGLAHLGLGTNFGKGKFVGPIEQLVIP